MRQNTLQAKSKQLNIGRQVRWNRVYRYKKTWIFIIHKPLLEYPM